jgi:acetyltransferase-like isoleucine patch superfamily enzyme
MSDRRPKSNVIPAEDPLNLLSILVTKLHSWWVGNTYPFASSGHHLSMHRTVILSRRVAPGIAIGNNVIIRNHAWINTFDLEGPEDVKIKLGDECVINAQCVISAKNNIHLKRGVMLSACSLVMDHNHAYEDTDRLIQNQGLTEGGEIVIEEGCWIGHGAVIVCSQGVLVLGRNSVVAANALVTKSFPPYSVIVGNPARLARQFNPMKGSWVGGEAGRSGPSGNGNERLSPLAPSRVSE